MRVPELTSVGECVEGTWSRYPRAPFQIHEDVVRDYEKRTSPSSSRLLSGLLVGHGRGLRVLPIMAILGPGRRKVRLVVAKVLPYRWEAAA